MHFPAFCAVGKWITIPIKKKKKDTSPRITQEVQFADNVAQVRKNEAKKTSRKRAYIILTPLNPTFF